MPAVWSNKCCEESKENWENRHRGDTFGSYFHVTAGSSGWCQGSELRCCSSYSEDRLGRTAEGVTGDIRRKEIRGTVLKLRDL